MLLYSIFKILEIFKTYSGVCVCVILAGTTLQSLNNVLIFHLYFRTPCELIPSLSTRSVNYRSVFILLHFKGKKKYLITPLNYRLAHHYRYTEQ